MNQLRVNEAYAIGEDGDHRGYYDSHAAVYDEDLIAGEGYIYHTEVSRIFIDHAAASDCPIADLGCGTGLLGESFRDSGLVIDGFDVSPGMLGEAEAKTVYRSLFEIDLTSRPTDRLHSYGGLVSCGTFTLGHLGPRALEKSLDLAGIHALSVIGINAVHFEKAGFGDHLSRLACLGRITRPDYEIVRIYSGNSDDALNLGRVAIFRVR